MRGIDRISAFAPLDLRPGTDTLKFYNTERVRGYLEQNLGCTNKEAARALDIDARTVSRAIRAIRGEG